MEVFEGLLWAGYIGECKKDKRTPCYVLEETELTETKKRIDDMEDGIFVCDVLKKYAGKQVKITIE
jgi:tetrahydromethanopterin S-methyltransferase subunit G